MQRAFSTVDRAPGAAVQKKCYLSHIVGDINEEIAVPSHEWCHQIQM